MDSSNHPAGEEIIPDHRQPAAHLGAAVHSVIGGLLYDGHSQPTPEVVLSAVGRYVGTEGFLRPRAPEHGSLLALVLAYFRFFVPDRGWVLHSRELDLGSARLDLVWQLPARLVLSDEIKTRPLGSLTAGDRLTGQLARQLRAATTHFGGAFVGIRLLCLAAPRHSVLIDPDGSIHPITQEERWLHRHAKFARSSVISS